MRCPGCGTEIPDDALECEHCGAAQRQESQESPAEPRTSRLAVASLILAVLGVGWLAILCWVPAIPRAVFQNTGVLGAICLGLLGWLPAIIAGANATDAIRRSEGRLRGSGLAWLAIALATGTIILAAGLGSAYLKRRMPISSLRAKVSRVRVDMRSMATAIEEYYLANNIYPPCAMGRNGPGGTGTYNYWIWRASGHDATVRSGRLPTFLLNGAAPNQRFATLTTPVSYITSYVADPFSRLRGSTFVYWHVYPDPNDPFQVMLKNEGGVGGVGFILISPGPDREYDIPGNWDVYNPAVSQPSPRLLAGTSKRGTAFTYDTTNGTMSRGDVWRVKQ